ncbi:MAG: hypothetical protein IJ789_07835 [Bacteroidales bacterium]|nr:hypothetical protein [Bacteroidales bacterium]
MKQLWLIATLVAGLALLASCRSEGNCRAVFGEGGVIALSEPKWHVLNTIGQSVTVNRGRKGIYVTRMSYDLFVAFECACPNDNDTRLLPDTEANFATDSLHYGEAVLRCPDCQSTFNAIDGQPLNGAACPLYQYSAELDGDLLLIR